MRCALVVALAASVSLLACTSSSRPAVAPCPAVASEPALPPEDAALVRWKQIAATADKAPPAGTTAAALVPELVGYLGSPDPERRDHIAYEVLATWIKSKRLTDDECRALVTTLVANLDAPGSVFQRSFSALVLAELVRRDREAPLLADDARRAVLAAVRAYAERETDLRGYTGATGWAHAAAHTGDLLAQLARSPAFTDADRALVLDAVAALVARTHGQRFAHGEDSRLAPSVIFAAKLGVPADAIPAFVAKLRAPLATPGTAAFDAGLYYAQRNARDLLVTLYVYGATTRGPSPGEAALYAAVRALIEE